MITAEMGKTLASARAEVEKCAATIDWIADNGPAILADEPVNVDGDDEVHVSYLPIGTVLAVMPWNFPLWQVIRASGPIMLSGNGFMLKHAPNVMGAAYALQEAYEAAGFPKGLFANLNADNDTVAGVIEDPRIAAVTLTGSMRAGAAVAATAGKALKKSLLELGGSDRLHRAGRCQYRPCGRGRHRGAVRERRPGLSRGQALHPRTADRRRVHAQVRGSGQAADRRRSAGSRPIAIGPMARGDLRDELHDQVEETLAQGATLLLGGQKIDGRRQFLRADRAGRRERRG